MEIIKCIADLCVAVGMMFGQSDIYARPASEAQWQNVSRTTATSSTPATDGAYIVWEEYLVPQGEVYLATRCGANWCTQLIPSSYHGRQPTVSNCAGVTTICWRDARSYRQLCTNSNDGRQWSLPRYSARVYLPYVNN